MRMKGKTISAKAVRELLDTNVHWIDPYLSRVMARSVYAFADGRALMVIGYGDERGLLYESHDEVVRRTGELEALAREPPVNMAGQLLPQGKGFIDAVPSLIADLPNRLPIADSALDFSLESLDQVGAAVRKRMKRALTPEVYAPLIAYAGEVLKRKVDGHWSMRLDQDGTTWLPWVVDRSGHGYSLFGFFGDLMEYEKEASLRAYLEGTLLAKRWMEPRSSSN